MKDYYKVLCIARDATTSQIQQAIESSKEIISASKNGKRTTRAQVIMLKDIRQAESCWLSRTYGDKFGLFKEV